METIIIVIVIIVIAFIILALGILLWGKLLEAGIENKYDESDNYWEELPQELLEEDSKNYPLGRYGKPEEVAAAIVYLLSDATVWMTGSQLLIDGGYSLK